MHICILTTEYTVKPVLFKEATQKRRSKIGFQERLSLSAGQKYNIECRKDCRMLPLEHSAILSTFIKLPFVIKIFVLSIFEWLLKTGFTVLTTYMHFLFFGVCRLAVR